MTAGQRVSGITGTQRRWKRTLVAAALGAVLVLSGCTNDATPGQPTGAAAEPSPAIVVDQFGYREEDPKVAVLRVARTGFDTDGGHVPGSDVDLVDASTGQAVLTGPAAPWNAGATDPVSGDEAWWFDFSSVRTAGEYFVRDAASGQRSATFTIGPHPYRSVVRESVRSFFYQRAGQDKPARLAGEKWADGASHLGPGQDTEARSWLAKDDPGTARDLRGGWYDAGDYNKYTPWHAGYLVTLLHAYRLHPKAVGDDLGIPESGNGLSDLVDEILWGLDWLERMQLEDGSMLSIEGLASASPPSGASGPSYYGPPTTYATQRSAAAFALAASVFATTDVPELQDRVDTLVHRARQAWEWSTDHPSVVWYNNDDSRQPGSGGLGAGQQEVDDAVRADSYVEASAYVYGATQDPDAREVVESRWQSFLPPGSQTQWTVDKQETLLYYASLPEVPAETVQQIRSSYQSALTSNAAFLPAIEGGADPYRAPMADYAWGSNGAKSQLGRMFVLARDYGFSEDLVRRAQPAAVEYLHYVHGVNPLGLVYLTNMTAAGAEHSARTLYHSWFADGTQWDEVSDQTPGPAPGLLVGGPNPYFAPSCDASGGEGACDQSWEPPLNQPPMKSYRQFNDDWPANSWEITENSNGYQVSYLRLLTAVAQP